MPTILRKIRRAALIGAKVQAGLSLGMVTYSLFGTDKIQQERLKSAPHVAMSSTSSGGRPTHVGSSTATAGSWGAWAAPLLFGGLRGNKTVELSEDEKACVDSMTRLLSMDYSNKNLSRFAKNVLLNDTLICFDGVSEMKDAWKFLWMFFRSSHAVATEIRRDVDTAGGVALHISYETDATTALGLLSGTFKSHVTLILENDQQRGTLSTPTFNGRAPRRIRAVEHRWLGGPILSRMTSTQENIIGDVGDLSRRINGFLMSLILTATTEDGTRPRIATASAARPPPAV